ncbi:TVP38/TMEM64 family protein [Pseudonocardia asaccharolytica DSM 44247 = NBRC 16224]|uniref:TVP38/TMEM64 family membrane protein n=1 Tax=Pseudonocardia asaccharolytica DSM 44247 = NBRC 16224 TaxID=1123024 RepID=A0A511D1M5_9PSEU|nr:TVP38/TMEM64 family protein [Pseudonocardia asaccharolytica DSM 44247 = NBRC 16224]
MGTVAAVAALVLLASANGVPGVGELQATMAAAGIWAPALFVALQAGLTVAPIPRTVFTLGAGLLFGSLPGLVLTLLASALAAVIAFVLVRATGGRLVARYARGPALHWVRSRLDHHGTLAVTSLRLIPLLPFSVLNYLAGLSTVRFVPYLLGTVIGILPGTVALVVLGDAVTGRPSPALLAVSAVCGLVGVGGTVLAARRPLPSEAGAARPLP